MMNWLRHAWTKLLSPPGAMSFVRAATYLLPLGLYWALISFKIPYSISRPFSETSSILFVAVAAAYYLAFRSRDRLITLLGLTLTMLLAGLTVSHLWTSGPTDNGMIGGLLPYKDAKNYYFGALQILEGLPLQSGINAIRRPLFPGLLATMLLFVGGNLKLAIAILAQLAGLGLFIAARALYRSFGPAAAALYAALLYFYIQPKLGYVVSEVPGFILGCLAFAILWIAAARHSRILIGFGLATLTAAISVRAGAFFVLPMMALWCGWVFRGARRYAPLTAGAWSIGIVVLYLLLNQGFSTLLQVRGVNQWSNFAYAMYGQVHGGTGWHSAIDDLDTVQGSVVAEATWRFFLAHPTSLAIGIAKSYRDFFLPGEVMIFPLGSAAEPAWMSIPLWAAVMLLLARGLIVAWTGRRLARASLLIAWFAGVLLSVPFLPPIDGGPRFHASTVALLFALPAAGLAERRSWGSVAEEETGAAAGSETTSAIIAAAILLTMAVIVPVAIQRLAVPLTPSAPECPAGETAFVVKTAPETYVDVVPASCGLLPRICTAAFARNATDKANDDLVQEILRMTGQSPAGIRITPGMNLLDAKFGYLISPNDGTPPFAAGMPISGCAVRIETRNSRLLEVTSQEQ